MLNYVRHYFQSLKGKKYSILSLKCYECLQKQRDDIKSNCCPIWSLMFCYFSSIKWIFFIISVGHLVRHSNIFFWTFIRNVRLSDRSDKFRHHCRWFWYWRHMWQTVTNAGTYIIGILFHFWFQFQLIVRWRVPRHVFSTRW